MAILNHVNHGITLSESSPSTTYTYTQTETATTEALTIPSLNGSYATVQGTRVYLPGTPNSTARDMSSASFRDVDGHLYEIYNEYDGSRYALVLDVDGVRTSTFTRGTSTQTFFLKYFTDGNMSPYDITTDKHFGRMSIRTSSSTGTRVADLVELDPYPLPQVKRQVTVTES